MQSLRVFTSPLKKFPSLVNKVIVALLIANTTIMARHELHIGMWMEFQIFYSFACCTALEQKQSAIHCWMYIRDDNGNNNNNNNGSNNNNINTMTTMGIILFSFFVWYPSSGSCSRSIRSFWINAAALKCAHWECESVYVHPVASRLRQHNNRWQ